jgi:hypothetical protein
MAAKATAGEAQAPSSAPPAALDRALIEFNEAEDSAVRRRRSASMWSRAA